MRKEYGFNSETDSDQESPSETLGKGKQAQMNLSSVQESLKAATPKGHEILLIAVSKMQPIETIKSVYDAGHRDFGENYIQELTEKAAVLADECPEINWHFIGALQSNKIPQLMRIGKGLKAIQTVDSLSKFDKIWKSVHKNFGSLNDRVIDLFLQVKIDG